MANFVTGLRRRQWIAINDQNEKRRASQGYNDFTPDTSEANNADPTPVDVTPAEQDQTITQN